MSERRITIGAAVISIWVVAMTVPFAEAGVDVSFGASVPLGDDGNLFFSISSRYFERDVRVVEDYGRRYFPDPDDLAVALHLSRHCRRGVEFFAGLRREGLGWFEISRRCDVPVDVWFVPVARDPGPPYGRAYGHWKKHRRDPSSRVVLTDADIRHLVAVRMASEYYGVPVETAMQWRREGRDVRSVMVGEYRKRHDAKGSHGHRGGPKGNGAGADRGHKSKPKH